MRPRADDTVTCNAVGCPKEDGWGSEGKRDADPSREWGTYDCALPSGDHTRQECPQQVDVSHVVDADRSDEDWVVSRIHLSALLPRKMTQRTS
jgi:hypothetical protein